VIFTPKQQENEAHCQFVTNLKSISMSIFYFYLLFKKNIE